MTINKTKRKKLKRVMNNIAMELYEEAMKDSVKKQVFDEFEQLLDNVDKYVPLETPEERAVANLIIAYLRDALNDLGNKIEK